MQSRSENRKKKQEKQAPIDRKIIVNAPPGTGKTYTVSKKIEYIVQNDIVPLEQVLVICFSRSALREIKERITIPEIQKRKLTIRTIDSFCSWVIKEIEEEKYKKIFNETTYEKRIEYVLKLLKSNMDLQNSIKNLKHIIIDEVQDIVRNTS